MIDWEEHLSHYLGIRRSQQLLKNQHSTHLPEKLQEGGENCNKITVKLPYLLFLKH